MKIACCFLGTKKYVEFLPGWWDRVQRLFCPGHEKTLFCFTDQLVQPEGKCHVYYTPHQNWSLVTLTRFETIQQAANELTNYDYFVFIDADAYVENVIYFEEFFADKHLVGVQHPNHYLGLQIYPSPWETRPESLACVGPEDDYSIYFQGCVWGGTVPAVLTLISELAGRIHTDLVNGITAVWWDESHLNKYYSERRDQVHVLPCNFAVPNLVQEFPRPIKIFHPDKDLGAFEAWEKIKG